MAAAVLASLFVVFLAVTVVMVLLHHSTPAPARTAAKAAVVTPDTGRLQAATKTLNSRTNTTDLALHSLAGIPTPSMVAAVINPYVSSLRHYQSVLSGTEVPSAARGAAAQVRASLSGDVRSLATINGLPPISLGTYLRAFGPDAGQLQKALGTLKRALQGHSG